MGSATLKATLEFLARTGNRAADDVLVAGLECAYRPTREGALRALLQRRSAAGHREVFRRLPTLDERARKIVKDRPDRLTEAATEALHHRSTKICKAGCEAVVSFRLYDVLPAAADALLDPRNPHTTLLAQAILKLTEAFYEELGGLGQQSHRKGRENVRLHATTALEEATRKFHRHRCKEVVEALLLLAKPSNATLRYLLQQPKQPAHQPIIELLQQSRRGGVIRLLLGFLEDPQIPQVVANVLGSRCDRKFLYHLLWSVKSRTSKTVAGSLARIDSIAWAQPGHEVLATLGGSAQVGAVRLLMASSMQRPKVLEMIGYFLREGHPAGRRAAAEALAEFEQPEASALVLQGLNDEDSHVRAHLIKQLRPRNISGAMSMMLGMVDGADKTVRAALRHALPEFTLQQFLPNFDSMPEESRAIAGHMIRRLEEDPQAGLAALMEGPSPIRRRRAVDAAAAMGLIPDMEERIIGLLSDEDHMVRAAAAKALADCKSMPSWDALREALLDRSAVVKEAAEESLERISRSLARQTEAEGEPETVMP